MGRADQWGSRGPGGSDQWTLGRKGGPGPRVHPMCPARAWRPQLSWLLGVEGRSPQSQVTKNRPLISASAQSCPTAPQGPCFWGSPPTDLHGDQPPTPWGAGTSRQHCPASLGPRAQMLVRAQPPQAGLRPLCEKDSGPGRKGWGTLSWDKAGGPCGRLPLPGGVLTPAVCKEGALPAGPLPAPAPWPRAVWSHGRGADPNLPPPPAAAGPGDLGKSR